MSTPLRFGQAISDAVTVAPAASINNLDPSTMLMWVYPTTLTNGRRYWHKGAATHRRLAVAATTSNLLFNVGRATTALAYTTNDAFMTTFKWHFIAVTFNTAAAAGEVANIYHGNLFQAIVESTYVASPVDGSGAVSDDSATGMFYGNRNGLDVAFEGLIAFCAMWNRQLTPYEIIEQQFAPVPTWGCVSFSFIGERGNPTVVDKSGKGNHGIISGAVPSIQTFPVIEREDRNVARWKRPLFPPVSFTPRLALLGAG